MTYDDILITSIVTIVKETNWMEKDTDFYQNVKFDLFHLRNVLWI